MHISFIVCTHSFRMCAFLPAQPLKHPFFISVCLMLCVKDYVCRFKEIKENGLSDTVTTSTYHNAPAYGMKLV